MSDLGRIEHFPLGRIFENETAFSKYLSENIDSLNDKLVHLELSEGNISTEEYIGEFRVDILGENFLIENQFHESDHDHLGKVLVARAWWMSHPRRDVYA
jgi:hypothetical protein